MKIMFACLGLLLGLVNTSLAQLKVSVDYDTTLVVHFTKEIFVPVDTVTDSIPYAVHDTVWKHDTLYLPSPGTTFAGVPYGPTQLLDDSVWTYGPAPFNYSLFGTSPSLVVKHLALAKKDRVKVVLNLTGGSHSIYITNGKFDFNKWLVKLKAYNTTAIKEAIATGVLDGTIVGYNVQDEPNFPDWGGVMTKPLLDSMARESKKIFPSLPTGVVIQHSWRPTETFNDLDFIISQFRLNRGDFTAYRDSALATTARQKMKLILSLNIIDGGKRVNKTCPWGEGWPALNEGVILCRMSPTEIEQGAYIFAQGVCAVNMWRADSLSMLRPEHGPVFQRVADSLAKLPYKSCKR